MGSTTLLPARRLRPRQNLANTTAPTARAMKVTGPPTCPDRLPARRVSAWQWIQVGSCREAGIAVLP